jgi:hypothetical protein
MRLGVMRCVRVAAALAWCGGCGGEVTHGLDADDAGSDAATLDGSAGAPVFDAALPEPLEDVTSDYVDPGCPPVDPPPATRECEPLAEVTGCGSGLACFPFVDHPFGQGCSQQRFGTICVVAGTGLQGDRCGNGIGSCAGGFLCVVGTRPGARCARLCAVDTQNSCPSGLICGETDIEGYGVCS